MKKIVNPFVYSYVLDNQMLNPTIPPVITETYSQCYEDVFIIQSLNAFFKRNKISQISMSYIEIGANHPVCTSSTFLFHQTYGISGILVEPDSLLVQELKKHRPFDTIIEAAVYAGDEKEIEFYISPQNEISSLNKDFIKHWYGDSNVGIKKFVKTVRINSLLEMVSNIDLVILIIDVEGYDFIILKDIDFSRYRPFIIEIEPSDHYKMGTSDQIVEYLKSKEYQLISQTPVNLIFQDIKRELRM